MSTPRIVFGAGGIGDTKESFTYTWTTPDSVSQLLHKLRELGVTELDSAAAYPPSNPWHTETLLGQAEAASKGFVIDSKILITKEKFNGALSESSIADSVEKSLSLLAAGKVNIMYAHAPDPVTPVEETAAAFDKQFRAGAFDELGLCNYSVAQLEAYLAVCDEHGYVKPSVIQDQYNALCREHERDLLPLLRKHGIRFYAYSPLAGGFLTGKVTFSKAQLETTRSRWTGASKFPPYSARYDNDAMHSAVRSLSAVCEAHGMSLTEASLRWIMHHSALSGDKGDALILGATRIEQLEGNVEMCRKGPLPDDVRRAVDAMADPSASSTSASSL